MGTYVMFSLIVWAIPGRLSRRAWHGSLVPKAGRLKAITEVDVCNTNNSETWPKRWLRSVALIKHLIASSKVLYFIC